MSNSTLSLSLHREALRRRCAAQREQLTDAVDAVQWRLRGIDRGITAVSKIRLAPTLLTLIPMILAVVPAFRRVRGALTIVNTLRRLFPSSR